MQFLDFDAMGWLPCKNPAQPGSQSEPRLGFRVPSGESRGLQGLADAESPEDESRF